MDRGELASAPLLQKAFEVGRHDGESGERRRLEMDWFLGCDVQEEKLGDMLSRVSRDGREGGDDGITWGECPRGRDGSMAGIVA